VKARAEKAAEDRVLDALVGANASEATREAFRRKLQTGELDDKEIELELAQQGASGLPMFDIPGQPGASIGMINIQETLGKAFGMGRKSRKISVKDAHAPLVAEESDRLLDDDDLMREAIRVTENDGIVFLDEIDKICARSDARGADVSREGVQRDLLPLIEGTTVSTKHGPVKTDHILFIASGAFHFAKPSDLLPELQGRLPIRVELAGLTRDDLRRILTEPEASLVTQYKAMLETEGLTLDFTPDGVDALADIAAEVNASVENIGARRLQTILERVLEDVSFSAPTRKGETVAITASLVHETVGKLAKNTDLSKFIL
jgi:ATP-dependent HslUV protease ATP-binding subunit HslU